MIIPIGIDCGNADFLRNHNLRNCSLPFDWSVTYNGVSDIIKNDFNTYIQSNCNTVNDSHTWFPHNTFPNDTETMLRRINRFKNILETTTEKITFIRKGHAFHHHKEHTVIKNDMKDANELDTILQQKYPTLNYEILVVLVCGTCFNSNEVYIPISPNIKLYNIATGTVENDKYRSLLYEILDIQK